VILPISYHIGLLFSRVLLDFFGSKAGMDGKLEKNKCDKKNVRILKKVFANSGKMCYNKLI